MSDTHKRKLDHEPSTTDLSPKPKKNKGNDASPVNHMPPVASAALDRNASSGHSELPTLTTLADTLPSLAEAAAAPSLDVEAIVKRHWAELEQHLLDPRMQTGSLQRFLPTVYDYQVLEIAVAKPSGCPSILPAVCRMSHEALITVSHRWMEDVNFVFGGEYNKSMAVEERTAFIKLLNRLSADGTYASHHIRRLTVPGFFGSPVAFTNICNYCVNLEELVLGILVDEKVSNMDAATYVKRHRLVNLQAVHLKKLTLVKAPASKAMTNPGPARVREWLIQLATHLLSLTNDVRLQVFVDTNDAWDLPGPAQLTKVSRPPIT